MCHAFQQINSLGVKHAKVDKVCSKWGRVGFVRGEVGLAVSICLVSVGFVLVDLVSVGLFPLQLVVFQLIRFGCFSFGCFSFG